MTSMIMILNASNSTIIYLYYTHVYIYAALITRRYNSGNDKLISQTISYEYVECYNTPYEKENERKAKIMSNKNKCFISA